MTRVLGSDERKAEGQTSRSRRDGDPARRPDLFANSSETLFKRGQTYLDDIVDNATNIIGAGKDVLRRKAKAGFTKAIHRGRQELGRYRTRADSHSGSDSGSLGCPDPSARSGAGSISLDYRPDEMRWGEDAERRRQEDADARSSRLSFGGLTDESEATNHRQVETFASDASRKPRTADIDAGDRHRRVGLQKIAQQKSNTRTESESDRQLPEQHPSTPTSKPILRKPVKRANRFPSLSRPAVPVPAAPVQVTPGPHERRNARVEKSRQGSHLQQALCG